MSLCSLHAKAWGSPSNAAVYACKPTPQPRGVVIVAGHWHSSKPCTRFFFPEKHNILPLHSLIHTARCLGVHRSSPCSPFFCDLAGAPPPPTSDSEDSESDEGLPQKCSRLDFLLEELLGWLCYARRNWCGWLRRQSSNDPERKNVEMSCLVQGHK